MSLLKKVNLLLLVLLWSCEVNDSNGIEQEVNNRSLINKIMPLGASRVEGARPEFESYRYELWKLLIDNGIAFNFVGTEVDESFYPAYKNKSFDADHEGRGGWTSGQILSLVTSSFEQTRLPDIILFSSPAGNDALEQLPYETAIKNIIDIINSIQALNPDITIIIEQMAPAKSDRMTQELTTYYNRLRSDILTISMEQSTANSKILVVDMATGFSDAMLADDVHYNDVGAKFIANRYFEMLEPILLK